MILWKINNECVGADLIKSYSNNCRFPLRKQLFYDVLIHILYIQNIKRFGYIESTIIIGNL